MSLHAGDRGRDDVERPRPTEPLRDPSHTVVVEVLEQGVVGSEGARPDARPELRFLVGERRLAEQAASPDLPSTSTISTLMPVRAAAVASAAVTVVFPTPPLPATITTREVAQKRSRSMSTDATGVLDRAPDATPHRVLRRPRGRRARLLAPRRGRRARRRSRSAGAASTSCRSRATSTRRTSRSSSTRSTKRTTVGPTLLVLQLNSSGAIDADIETVVARHQPLDGARSRCGSARRAPTPRAPPPSSSRPPTSPTCRPGPAPGPGTRCASTTRTPAPAPAWPTAWPRWPRATVATPTAPGSSPARASARPRRSAVGATNGVRPTVGEVIVQLDGKTVTTAAGHGEALDGQGRSAPARDRRRQPNQDVRVQPARPRRVSCCTA